MRKRALFFSISFLLGGFFSLALAFLVGKYFYSDIDVIESDLREMQYETQFLEYSFSESYCSNLYTENTVRELYGLINSYIFQHQNDASLEGFDYQIFLSFGRLAKIYLENGQEDKASRALHLATAIYGIAVSGAEDVEESTIYKVIEKNDVKLCRNLESSKPLP